MPAPRNDTSSSVLVFRSVGTALTDLQRATERVAARDYTARVPVAATDDGCNGISPHPSSIGPTVVQP